MIFVIVDGHDHRGKSSAQVSNPRGFAMKSVPHESCAEYDVRLFLCELRDRDGMCSFMHNHRRQCGHKNPASRRGHAPSPKWNTSFACKSMYPACLLCAHLCSKSSRTYHVLYAFSQHACLIDDHKSSIDSKNAGSQMIDYSRNNVSFRQRSPSCRVVLLKNHLDADVALDNLEPLDADAHRHFADFERKCNQQLTPKPEPGAQHASTIKSNQSPRIATLHG